MFPLYILKRPFGYVAPVTRDVNPRETAVNFKTFGHVASVTREVNPRETAVNFKTRGLEVTLRLDMKVIPD